MAGTSQASNLSGMLNSIAETIGEMGGAGHQFVDSFRTSQAPPLTRTTPPACVPTLTGRCVTVTRRRPRGIRWPPDRWSRSRAHEGRLLMLRASSRASRRKLEEARASAINNAGGDKEAIAKINGQYDTAVNAVSGKLNDMSAQYGLDVTGTGTVQGVRDKQMVVAQLKSEIETEKNSRKKAQLSRLLVGVESDMISPKEAIEATTTGSLASGNRTVQRSVNYKDGSIQAVYNDGYTEITTAAGNTFAPGDDGYEQATTSARDSGVSYAGDVAGATEGSKQAVIDSTSVAEEYMASRQTQGTYEAARKTVEDMEDYSFGKVAEQFPDFSAGSLKLQNFKTQMGLDVIAGGNFGPLSEGELKLALNQGIPEGLSKQETLKWIDDRIEAEKMVQRAAEDYMRWSSENPGKTRAAYIMDRSIDAGKENEPSGADNDGASLSEDPEPQGGQITLSNGAVARKVS